MVGREARPLGVLIDPRDPQRPGVVDEETEQSLPLGQPTDRGIRVGVDADGDEPGQSAAGLVEDAERPVPGIDE